MRYTTFNLLRVVLCYAAMLAACEFLYPRLFDYKAGIWLFPFYIFFFFPLRRLSLFRRTLVFTLGAFVWAALLMIRWFIYYPDNFQREMVQDLPILLYTMFGPHYFVFLVSYIVLEFLVMRRFAAKPGQFSGRVEL